MINLRLAEQLKLTPHSCPSFALRFANSSNMTVSKRYRIPVTYLQTTVLLWLYPVLNLPYDLLLGLNFFRKACISLTCSPKSIRVLTNNQPLATILPVNAVTDPPLVYKCILVQNEIVPARTAKKIFIRIPDVEFGTVMVEPSTSFTERHHVILTRTLVHIKQHQAFVFILNLSSVPLFLHKYTTVGTIDFSTPVQHSGKIEPKTNESEPLEYKINQNLQPDEKVKLKRLLEKHRKLFATSLFDLTQNDTIQHVIELLPDQRPISSRPYRIAETQRLAVDQQLVEMLEHNIIQPSKSPWSSPIVLVRKKNGQYRFCTDFRKLNAVTVKDVYPLPRIDDTLQALSGQRYFSSLDMYSGYWQVPLSYSSRKYSAFVTHRGLHEWCVVPFGLCNAPSDFQRMMEKVLLGLIYNICIVYLDDVCVFSKTFDEHLENLETVFHACAKAKLKLQFAKCTFAENSLRFLGFVISAEGIATDPTKIEAVKNYPTPMTVKDVRSFLGLIGFYRKYVKNFAIIAHPLSTLLKKEAKFEWSDECERSFRTLIDKLITAPILRHFNPKLPIAVSTDASQYAIGSVIWQTEGSEKYVIGYHSRTLNQHEQNYSTSEKECLGLIHAIKINRQYLLGKHVDIYTDHHSLCFLSKIKESGGRLVRWSLILAEYDYTIHYKKGTCHLDADCMSRIRHKPEVPPTEADEIPIFAAEIIDLKSSQSSDPYCAKIIELLELKDERAINKGFSLVEGILHRSVKAEQSMTLKVLPKSLLPIVLHFLHDRPESGHTGVVKTLARVKDRFYRPGLATDVLKYVYSCDVCQQRKQSTKKPVGLMNRMPTSTVPFEAIEIDFCGPLGITPNGNQYIIVAVDVATRFIEAKATQSHNASDTVRFLIENICLRYRIPSYIQSDRGSHFTARVIEELMRELNVKHKLSSPYSPSTNGLVERANGTIASTLSMFIQKEPHRWDEALKFAVFALNTSVSKAHSLTPYELLYAIPPPSPLDLVFKPGHSHEYLMEMFMNIHKVRALAEVRIRMSQDQSAKQYDKHHRQFDYKVGDQVWLRRSTVPPGSIKKFIFKYRGPFVITRSTGNLSFTLYDLRPSTLPVHRVVSAHVRQLKKCIRRPDDLKLSNGDLDTTADQSTLGQTNVALDKDTLPAFIRIDETPPQCTLEELEYNDSTDEEGEELAEAIQEDNVPLDPQMLDIDLQVETQPNEPVETEEDNDGLPTLNNEVPVVRTRSGRVSKPPERFGDLEN